MTAASWSQNREGLHFAVIFSLKQVKSVSLISHFFFSASYDRFALFKIPNLQTSSSCFKRMTKSWMTN